MEKIGTPEALEAIDKFRNSGPTLIESSIEDGALGVDAEFINENGIILRFGSCSVRTAAGETMWEKSFKGNAVTLKPRRGDLKLINGAFYTLNVRATDEFYRSYRTKIAFTTKR